MYILCDTSSILMLLRIAPDMFIDERYACKMIREIHDEIVQTTKFKTKYPWTRGMRASLRPSVLTTQQKQKEALFFGMIRELNRQGVIHKKRKRLIDLSWKDMKVLSHALALEYQLTTGDNDLEQFAGQEFKGDFRGNVPPLEIINNWLEKGLIEWNEQKQEYLSAWMEDHEHPQPAMEKKRFNELTGYKYSGS